MLQQQQSNPQTQTLSTLNKLHILQSDAQQYVNTYPQPYFRYKTIALSFLQQNPTQLNTILNNRNINKQNMRVFSPVIDSTILVVHHCDMYHLDADGNVLAINTRPYNNILRQAWMVRPDIIILWMQVGYGGKHYIAQWNISTHEYTISQQYHSNTKFILYSQTQLLGMIQTPQYYSSDPIDRYLAITYIKYPLFHPYSSLQNASIYTFSIDYYNIKIKYIDINRIIKLNNYSGFVLDTG